MADLVALTSVPLHVQRWTFDALQLDSILKTFNATSGENSASLVTVFHIIARATNVAGLTSQSSASVVVDDTAPEVTGVVVVTSATVNASDGQVLCQTAESYLELDVQGLKDTESGIERLEAT
jgi:hypothetical protein